MIDQSIIDAAHELRVEPGALFAAVYAVSTCRRGAGDEWSQHDLTITICCLEAFIAAGGTRP